MQHFSQPISPLLVASGQIHRFLTETIIRCQEMEASATLSAIDFEIKLDQFTALYEKYTTDDGLLVVKGWADCYDKNDPIRKIDQTNNYTADLLINILFLKTMERLIRVGGKFQVDLGNLIEWKELSYYSFNAIFWDEKNGLYQHPRWAEISKPFYHITAYLPLYANIPSQDQAEEMLINLLDPELLSAKENDLFPTWWNNSIDTNSYSDYFNGFLAKGVETYFS